MVEYSHTRPRVAFLTIGQGDLASSVYKALGQHTDLVGVVFSRKEKRGHPWIRFREYGFWYTTQYLLQRILSLLRPTGLTPEILSADGVDYLVWNESSDENDVIRWLLSKDVSHVYVCGFQFILSERFITQFEHCFNIHPSLLPDYRGPEPIAWGLLEKQNQFGWTMHLVERNLDTGRIVAQCRVSRPLLPFIAMVEAKLAATIAPKMENCLRDIEAAVARSRVQTPGFYLPAPTLENRKKRKKELL